jgi:hypothetical protein
MGHERRNSMETTMAGNNPDENAVQSLTIQDRKFTIPLPYAAGACILTEGEANALNQTFAENIRNNFAQQMKRAAEDKDNPKQIGQDELDEYVESYEFGKRAGGARGPRDPVGTEEKKLATVAVQAHVEKAGKKWKDLAKEKQDELVAKVISSGRFRERAEKIVADRQASAADLDGMDLGEAA